MVRTKTSTALVPAGNRLKRWYSDSFLNEDHVSQLQEIYFSREDMIPANVIPVEFKKSNLPRNVTKSAEGRINQPSFINKLQEETFFTSQREINKKFLAFPRETSIQFTASDMSLSEMKYTMSNGEIQSRLKPLPDDCMILGDFQCSSRITNDSWLNELHEGCTVKFYEAAQEGHGRGNQSNDILLHSKDSEHEQFINMLRGEDLKYASPCSSEPPAPMAPDIINAGLHKNSECQEGNGEEIEMTDSNSSWLIEFSEENDKFQDIYPEVFSSPLSTDILKTKGDTDHEEKNNKLKYEIDRKANRVQDVALKVDEQEEYGKVIDKCEEHEKESYLDRQQHLNLNASTCREDEQIGRMIQTALENDAVARRRHRREHFGLVIPFLIVVVPLVVGIYYFLKFFID